MKKLLLALLLISSPVYAYNVTGSVGYGLDQVGVQASGDVTVPCDAGAGLKSSGGGVWACGTFGGSGSVPTGTGFYHVNAGSADSSARSVNLASSDVTGVLPLANMGSPTSTGFVHVNSGTTDGVSRAVNLASDDVTGILPIGNLSQNTNAKAINFIIDGGGSAITTGIKGVIEVPYAMDIVAWSTYGDQTGSIQLDLWKDTFANYPPTATDSITGTEKPNLVSAVKSQDVALTTWTGKSVASGDSIIVSVDSVATVQRVTLSLWGRKTS